MQDTITIEEAIKHCEEVAYQNEILMKRYDDASGYSRSHNEKIRTDGAKGCEHLTSLYRQMAEWLRELKKWRALRDSINMLCDVDCEYPQYRESGTMCDACPIGTAKDYFEQVFDEEVNADGDSY